MPLLIVHKKLKNKKLLLLLTAVDAISSGYRTILLDDCCRGVDLKDIENVKETVVSTNGVIVTSKEV